MINLIATDMDGTLLNAEREIDVEFFEILKHLRSKNILVVLASGREYNSLVNLVPKEYRNELIFACNNGNYIEFQGETLFESYIDKSMFEKLISKLESIEDLKVLMSTKNSIFTNSMQNYFIYKLKGQKITFLKHFECLKEDVIKCTLITEESKQKEVLNELKELDEILEIVPSGKRSIDITTKGVHKGTAIKFLQDKYNITYNETMAFGDYLNDIEMMKVAFYSYAMRNAHPELKNYARFTAGYNHQRGVIEEIVKRVI